MDEIEQLLIKMTDADLNERWKALTLAEKHRFDMRVREAVIDRLDDPAPDVRAQAARLLHLAYDRQGRIAPKLVGLLTDPVPEVRAAAATGLGGRYYREALDALLDRLHDVEAEVRIEAATALYSYSSYRTVQHLIWSLSDEEPGVRCAAANSLISLNHRDAIKPLLKIALNLEEKSEVRQQAIEALGYLAHKGNTTSLDMLLEERDVVGRLLDLVDDEDDEVARNAIAALERLGDQRAVEKLVARLCDWHEEFGRRLWSLGALGHLNDFRVTPILIATLQDPKPMLRPFAARALGDLCDPAALPALDQLITDEPDKLSEAAAKAAAHIRYEMSWQEFDRVVEYLHNGSEQEQERALEWLDTWDDPRGLELILEKLTASLEPGRMIIFAHATKLLANRGEARALPVLAEAAEFWRGKKLVGMVDDAEDAADYIRRKLNGEELKPYISITDDEEYELDDLDGTDNLSPYGNL